MKVVMLMPALMMENNRKVNNSALDYALQHYDIDLFVINDQEFKDFDYREDSRVHYLNGNYTERQGFVKGRNKLLEWFYDSDYDWAVWLDANSKITKTTINDFRTVINSIKAGEIKVDVILSTLGIYISETRMLARKADDHLDNIKLTSVAKTESAWMHGLFMRNFKKSYGVEIYIHEDCDPHIGLSEDVYFVQLVKELFEVRQCPTIIASKPPGKASTWMKDKKNYRYPPIDWKGISRMIARDKQPFVNIRPKELLKETYVIPRIEYMKDKVTIYKDRKKKKGVGGLI